jgi:hypothetical protein
LTTEVSGTPELIQTLVGKPSRWVMRYFILFLETLNLSTVVMQNFSEQGREKGVLELGKLELAE